MIANGLMKSRLDWDRYMPMWEEYPTDPATTPPEQLVTYSHMAQSTASRELHVRYPSIPDKGCQAFPLPVPTVRRQDRSRRVVRVGSRRQVSSTGEAGYLDGR
jgi:hypothetical protein